jgi:hypothetical protein
VEPLGFGLQSVLFWVQEARKKHDKFFNFIVRVMFSPLLKLSNRLNLNQVVWEAISIP